MNHKVSVCCAACTVASLAVFGVTNDWENTQVNSINRLPARTYSMPLADEKAALTDVLEPATPFKKSLNGIWKLSWAGDPALRVKDFWAVGFDDSRWFEIDVPSCVETRGFGSPGYTNATYPHANNSNPKKENFAKILDRDTLKGDYNPVSSYRTRFTIPANWQDRDIILRFDGVYSAYYVWVNGEKVGYAEDSKLPSEFDITKFVKPGENVLAVEVYRWSDGSFLEDQDMFRYSGIYRDVTLWARPKDGIWDFAVKTLPVGGYANWKLELAVDAVDSATLYDAQFNKVGDLAKGADGTYSLALKAEMWSAEKPYLYTLVLKKGADIRMKRVGFKEQKVVGNSILVNGRMIKFKGVNRHECSPENGRTVSLAEMVEDVTLMKRYNVNTVRTCHYPDHHSWYDLCDKYGLYVVAEANVEGHEPGYGDNGIGRFPEWDHTIVERNVRNVLFQRNNPCVTLWSMGNETGHGDCFRHAIAQVKAIDPSRPIHWEIGNEDADVDSWMYPSVEWLDLRGKLGDQVKKGTEVKKDGEFASLSQQSAGKAFFLCEYAHAMGTAVGNFAEYWDVFYKYDSLTGGCIWDWIDQGIWKETDRIDPVTKQRERFLAYGGDWDESPDDGPFCCNGLIGPERKPSSKLREVAHVHRNLVVTRAQGASDNPHAVVFGLWNRFGFTRADEFDCTWELKANGNVIQKGAFEVPALAPLSRCRFTVPGLAEALASAPAGMELFVDFAFVTKREELWAPRGWVVARDQVAVDPVGFHPAEPLEGGPVKVEQDDKTLTVVSGHTRATFCRLTGTLCELSMEGKTILKDKAPGLATGPRLTCLRAFTDNDRWMRDGGNWGEDRKSGSCYSRGLTELRYHARPIVIAGNKVKTSVLVTGSKSAGFEHECEWTFAADGSVEIANTVTPHGTMPPALPRLGLSMVLDPSLEKMVWYGRGPHENYVDRCTGAFFGVWKSTVTAQYEGQVRPQDCGYKSDVRWVALTDRLGRGVKFTASEPLFVQALHYAREDLELARHRSGMKRYRAPLVARKDVMLNLDVRQTGLGGASCGPRPMAKYVFPIRPESWRLCISPVVVVAQ